MKVGVQKGLPTFKCTSSKGFVLCLTATLMNLFLCMAWMQTVHIETSFVYLPIRYFIEVGFIQTSYQFQIPDSESVSGLLVG